MQDNIYFTRTYHPIPTYVYVYVHICLYKQEANTTECTPACEHWLHKDGAEWGMMISFPFIHLY